MLYFSFAIADSMFSSSATLVKKSITAQEAKELLTDGYESACNPSHRATLNALSARYGITVDVPDVAPKVSLAQGDSVLVFSVRGLPRLGADRHEYTSEEVASATFVFSHWEVLD